MLATARTGADGALTDIGDVSAPGKAVIERAIDAPDRDAAGRTQWLARHTGAVRGERRLSVDDRNAPLAYFSSSKRLPRSDHLSVQAVIQWR